MPNKNTPPKHKTPNYKLVTLTYPSVNWMGDKVTRTVSHWEPQSLRAGRKDS